MKKKLLAWLIPLILLLILIPFIVPSALPDAVAEELDVPEYEPVELTNPNPGPVPTEEVSWGKKGRICHQRKGEKPGIPGRYNLRQNR